MSASKYTNPYYYQHDIVFEHPENKPQRRPFRDWHPEEARDALGLTPGLQEIPSHEHMPWSWAKALVDKWNREASKITSARYRYSLDPEPPEPEPTPAQPEIYHVVVSGNAIDGLNLIGPFDDFDKAHEWAMLKCRETWQVVQLTAPTN